jgi:hypothetical protein
LQLKSEALNRIPSLGHSPRPPPTRVIPNRRVAARLLARAGELAGRVLGGKSAVRLCAANPWVLVFVDEKIKTVISTGAAQFFLPRSLLRTRRAAQWRKSSSISLVFALSLMV